MKYIPKPSSSDYAPYFETYVGEVANEDIRTLLYKNAFATPAFLMDLTEDQWKFRYAPGKWSIAEIVEHLMDAEQVFCYRTLRIARGDKTPMPGFDHNKYVENSKSDSRDRIELIKEYHTTRMATIALLEGLDDTVAHNRGMASENEVTVAALFYIIAGHERHHLGVIKSRYLL